MDFLKDLIEINNKLYLEKVASSKDLDEEIVIQKYNKRNNRLFKPCQKYKIDEYKLKVEKYNLYLMRPHN